ncbi:hypothetical protein BY996DRAFT_6448441 [Phakopsora pachyrhizi]|nr:hypothetical protein BY996DRAFT_6448441 [Phakopsora pachyrhizi]
MRAPVLRELMKRRITSDIDMSCSTSTMNFFDQLLDKSRERPRILSEEESEILPFVIGIIDQKEVFDNQSWLERRLNKFKDLKILRII